LGEAIDKEETLLLPSQGYLPNPSSAGSMLFKEAINKFIEWKQINSSKGTLKGYELDLRNFCLYMRNPHIETVKLEDITEYFNLMAELGWKWNGFVTKSIALRKMFQFYRRQGYEVLDHQLIPIPKREYNPPRVATEEEYAKLLNVIPQDSNDPRHIRNLAIVSMLWDTGARVGELMSLKVQDIKLDQMKALVKTEKSKGMKPFRQIFWSEETSQNLKRWIEKRAELKKRTKFKDPDALFVGACRWQLGKRLTSNAVSIFLRRYSSKAGIQTLNAHSFRHHLGHELAKKGASNSVISNILGHSALTSSYVYTMLSNKELETEYRKLVVR
jgi:site-specific recombinase XerD